MTTKAIGKRALEHAERVIMLGNHFRKAHQMDHSLDEQCAQMGLKLETYPGQGHNAR